jgi:HEAT repeat protein
MDAAQAMPLLKGVLARRDACSEALRAKAVFLVAQKAGNDAESVLLDVVRNDPSAEVRGQAVFWLGQSGGERAVDAIEQILRTSRDADIQEKAVFATACPATCARRRSSGSGSTPRPTTRSSCAACSPGCVTAT